MKDQLISLDTAILAKEKGVDLRIASYNYSEENNYELGFNIYTKEDLINFKIYPALTQSLLQKWLREVHNIQLSVWYNFLTEKYRADQDKKELEYPTYEEALEVGLQEALKLIN